MSGAQIILTQKDYSKLKEMKSFHPNNEYKKLEDEMEHAKIVSAVPLNTVTMNSKTSILILDENRKMTLTIVYPREADYFQNKISVLSPLGLGLLGLKVGDAIDWTFPDGKIKTIKVLAVQQLPELITSTLGRY